MPSKIDLRNYIKSNEYFNDALKWYYDRYVNFGPQIIFLWLSNIAFIIAVASLLLSMSYLFPYVIKINYAIDVKSPENKAIHISHANYIPSDARLSLASVFLENYVQKRESYSYHSLNTQADYIRNSSTRMVFNKFKKLYDIQNTESIPTKYQDTTLRDINIISCRYLDDNNAIILFEAVARSQKHKDPVENGLWEAKITFEIDKFLPNLANNREFHFVVTEYETYPIKSGKK